MGEKLTLTRYLQGRGEVKALTHIEALAFGVPYPLKPGWPARHGAMEITEGMIADLKTRIATAKKSTASKARGGLEGIGVELPTQRPSSAPAAQQARPALTPGGALKTAPVRSILFPGFVLRRPKSYRSRSSAPWA